jgi:hypothetical protein
VIKARACPGEALNSDPKGLDHKYTTSLKNLARDKRRHIKGGTFPRGSSLVIIKGAYSQILHQPEETCQGKH